MSFYKFDKGDIFNVNIATHPHTIFELNGDKMTGSVYLERQFLNSDLATRYFYGFSEKKGGLTIETPPFTASIDIMTSTTGSVPIKGVNNAGVMGTNSQLFETIRHLYSDYVITDGRYQFSYAGSTVNTIRVITIPEVFYDKEILSGTFSASDADSAGDTRRIYDNGYGGLYSGSLTGTLVGNIFYSEGLAVLTKPDLNDFGSVAPDNFKWRVEFRGVHNIPCKIFKCLAPAGQLNCSTNESFYRTATSGDNKGFREAIHTGSTYITSIGLYNDDFELVGYCTLGQAIRKTLSESIIFRIKLDF